jgi:hypothetical protein
MAEKFDNLNQKHIDFINKQHLFFIGSAGAEGFVNVSPKGMDTLKVISPTKVVWLNHTGSGNETAAHVAENGRMTIMWCSFDKKPLILKLYGDAKAIHPRDKEWDEMCGYFDTFVGTRQFFELNISLVLTSCGYGVPRYEYMSERDTLIKWGDNLGDAGVKKYWKEENQVSLDGKKTYVLDEGDV